MTTLVKEPEGIRKYITEKREIKLHEQVKNAFFDIMDHDPQATQGYIISTVYDLLQNGKTTFELFLMGNMLMYFMEWYRKQQLMLTTKELMKKELEMKPKEGSVSQ